MLGPCTLRSWAVNTPRNGDKLSIVNIASENRCGAVKHAYARRPFAHYRIDGPSQPGPGLQQGQAPQTEGAKRHNADAISGGDERANSDLRPCDERGDRAETKT